MLSKNFLGTLRRGNSGSRAIISGCDQEIWSLLIDIEVINCHLKGSARKSAVDLSDHGIFAILRCPHKSHRSLRNRSMGSGEPRKCVFGIAILFDRNHSKGRLSRGDRDTAMLLDKRSLSRSSNISETRRKT
jgi:hypothetical protein